MEKRCRGNTGQYGFRILALIDEYETQKLECRRGLADEDVGESADFRRYRESRGLPYVELADRLSRPGYLEGAMLSLRSRQQYCPGTFDTIQCAALMPNLPMHKACVDSQERGSACRSYLAAREAKLLSVLTCESNAAKQIWGGSAIDRAQDFATYLNECVIPSEKAAETSQRASAVQDLFQQHLAFGGAAALIASLALAGITLSLSLFARRSS